jgi:serine O-acetyltransferase
MDKEFIELLLKRNNYHTGLPGKEPVHDFAEKLFCFLFITQWEPGNAAQQLQLHLHELRTTFTAILPGLVRNEAEIKKAERTFFDALPLLYNNLLADAAAILHFDPAAESLQEVLVAYPGFFATAIYRLAHQLYGQRIPILPRLLLEYAHSKTGIDIHPGATIGKSFFIDHGTGIVIGESAIIGDNVKIYQGVTIGALSVAKEYAKQKRHPTIEDDVTIYSGATILGGETIVGHDSIIGGNVWLTTSVDPYSIVYHKSDIVVRGKFPLPEPLNFII